MNAHMERIRQDPGLFILLGGGKQFFLTTVHHFVGAGIVRVLMLYNLIRHQVVLQIRVRQILGEVIHDRLNVAPGFHPRRIRVLRVGFGCIFGQQAKFGDMAAHLRQFILAIHQYPGKPAEVVKAKVIHLQLVAIHTQNGPYVTHGCDRHIANIQHPGFWPQAAHTLGDDGRRVRVVNDPRFFVGITINHVDQLNHWQNGAQTVRQPARAAGLLADNAVTQGDLLILLAHFVLTDTHLGEDEMGTAKGHFRVAGDDKFNALTVIANHLLHHRRDGVLPRVINVVEANFRQREFVQLHHQAFHNPWRIGAATTGDRENKWGCNHVYLLQRTVSTASRIFLTCSP